MRPFTGEIGDFLQKKRKKEQKRDKTEAGSKILLTRPPFVFLHGKHFLAHTDEFNCRKKCDIRNHYLQEHYFSVLLYQCITRAKFAHIQINSK